MQQTCLLIFFFICAGTIHSCGQSSTQKFEGFTMFNEIPEEVVGNVSIIESDSLRVGTYYDSWEEVESSGFESHMDILYALLVIPEWKSQLAQGDGKVNLPRITYRKRTEPNLLLGEFQPSGNGLDTFIPAEEYLIMNRFAEFYVDGIWYKYIDLTYKLVPLRPKVEKKIGLFLKMHNGRWYIISPSQESEIAHRLFDFFEGINHKIFDKYIKMATLQFLPAQLDDPFYEDYIHTLFAVKPFQTISLKTNLIVNPKRISINWTRLLDLYEAQRKRTDNAFWQMLLKP